MVELELLQTASYLIAALSFAITCAYYIMNLKNTQKNMQMTLETRQAQLFVQLYSQYYNKDWVASQSKVGKMKYNSYEEFWEKYGNAEEVQSWDTLSHYYEGAGILVRKGLIDSSLVSDLFSEEFVGYWEKMHPFILEYRIRENKPKVCENQEYLYNLIKSSSKD